MGAGESGNHEISCRITRTLITYIQDLNGSLGNFLNGLELNEEYLADTNKRVSHAYPHILYPDGQHPQG